MDIRPLEPPHVRLALSRTRGKYKNGCQDVPMRNLPRCDADFADLAKEHSKDADTSRNGGEIASWLKAGGSLREIPGAEGLEAAVFALEPGQAAQAPVKSSRGFHVVKLTQKKDARVKPLSEVRQ